MSYLVKYKKSGIEYPLPVAYAEEQTKQKSKNSIYSRFIQELVRLPTIDPVNKKYIPEENMETSMMFMFIQFTTWLRMRKTTHQIDFDKFNEQMSDLFKQMKPPMVGKKNDQDEFIYPVALKNLVPHGQIRPPQQQQQFNTYNPHNQYNQQMNQMSRPYLP